MIKKQSYAVPCNMILKLGFISGFHYKSHLIFLLALLFSEF